MKVYVLVEWCDNVAGVVSTEARARELGYIADTGEDRKRHISEITSGVFMDCIVDDPDLT